MGTNYYIKEKPPCPTCGHGGTDIHLGKSSAGWAFTFQYNGGEYYKTVVEMREWTRGKQIFNEYGEKVSFEEFWDMVEAKQEGMQHSEVTKDFNALMIDGYSFVNTEFC